MKRWMSMGICLLMLALCTRACALMLPVEGGGVEIDPTMLDDQQWMFLPAFVDLAALYPDAQETEEAGVWYDEASNMYLMQSANLRTVFLFSDDPIDRGREWLEDCFRHENETTGSMALVNAQGQVEHADTLRQLRGRGNYTWKQSKKSYQFKLENRADLLKTGDSENRSRTWLLMSETLDASMLHNRIAQDMALELGMEAAETEFVDLYYDGEYRGLYLLSEKVEIDPGRVDEMDYDDLLEKWNSKVGQFDLAALPAASAQNSRGLEFTYIDGVIDNGDPSSGAYLVEMENEAITLSDRCYFRLEDGRPYAVKNPENASESMMRYISEKLAAGRSAIENGGVDPVTGITAEEAFDLDSFARTVLLYELSHNGDAFTYSSTYFVLPAGESRIRSGPAWDFDLAFRYEWNGVNANGAGFKDSSWMQDFYKTEAFMEIARKVYLDQMHPLVTDTLLGTQEREHLKPLDVYAAEIAPSARMNGKLHYMAMDGRYRYAESREADVELLRDFLNKRSTWLHRMMTDIQPGENHIALWMDSCYGYADEKLRILTCPWQGVTVDEIDCYVSEDADEENYAVWQAEAYLTIPSGMNVEEVTVSMNGTPLACEVQEDGRLYICFVFEDPSYRVVDYYGEDIGLVYDYETYIRNYPEVAEACEYDPQAVMDYFCDEGMYEGHVGNAYFDPRQALELNSHLYHMFGEDWQLYYWEYIYYGHDEGWMKQQNKYFVPAVVDAM